MTDVKDRWILSRREQNKMDIRKKLGFLRQNIFIYILGCFLVLGMKYFYSKADCEGLRWILGPTARWVEILSGIPFAYEPGLGYANHGLRFLIAPSCSGVQFMIITAAMLIFSFSHYAAGFCPGKGCRLERPDAEDPLPDGCLSKSPASPIGKENAPGAGGRWSSLCGLASCHGNASGAGVRFPQTIWRNVLGLGWIVLSLLLSYGFTVFVNGLRIVVAIYLPSFFERAGAFKGLLTPDRLHTMIGVVVYFAALMTIYRLVGLFFYRDNGTEKERLQTVRKCLPPVFWYFFIVLGVPFLNRAYRGNNGKFTEFVLSVVLCCGCVLVLYCIGAVIRKKVWSRG